MGAELTVHLGCGKHDPAGRNPGNSRNGITPKNLKVESGRLKEVFPIVYVDALWGKVRANGQMAGVAVRQGTGNPESTYMWNGRLSESSVMERDDSCESPFFFRDRPQWTGRL